jgi:outer membrane receptor for ferrienterochelin and colicin
VEFRLALADFLLEPVVADGPPGPDLTGSGFERRRANHSGSGRFLDRWQLQERQSSTLADIFRTFPGLHIHATSGSQHEPRALDAGAGRPCFVQVYVDGTFVSRNEQFDLRDFPPESLEAMEYYRHPSSTPPEFRTGRSPCGVLVLWTRRA